MKVQNSLCLAFIAFHLVSFTTPKKEQYICDISKIIANDEKLFIAKSTDGQQNIDSIGRITEVATSETIITLKKIIIYDTLNFFSFKKCDNLKSIISIVKCLPKDINTSKKNTNKGVYLLTAVGKNGDTIGISLKDLNDLTYIIYTFKVENNQVKLVESKRSIF